MPMLVVSMCFLMQSLFIHGYSIYIKGMAIGYTVPVDVAPALPQAVMDKLMAAIIAITTFLFNVVFVIVVSPSRI